MNNNSIWNKLYIDKILFLFITLILVYSIFLIWSASGQDIKMMERKIIQIFIGMVVMLLLAQVPPRKYESNALYLYIICILLLILVKLFGPINKGAQRWLNLSFLRFQPSEMAKIAVPLMVVRFINRDSYPPSFKATLIILVIIFIPTLLVATQPDLGTAILIAISGLFILFLSGISWKSIMITLSLFTAFLPILWNFFMHNYQRDRIMILFSPDLDPLGSGYHIIQSKIATGSGGFTGKGWLHGTQSQLEFLPERHTDFIFAVLGEELGFIGVLLLLVLYLGIIIRGLIIAIQAQNTFGRVITGSIILTLFAYVFINIGMVTGILPIVGIPLPLISYGGSSLIVLMASFGMIMSIHTHRKMLSKHL
ncbi:peptidoglycan glycosyltransferase MrdB [Candidatus Schneideria nysicola]|uniref:peptidoglycan glycosyltransferase MrdB n=1 Tax=Candidatus Schneideria nysicola TaxID=1081631 RepID=UPI001CAA77ED|nr:peptidoglycan glycosyltransferase MrdB [Candidatus Schneideria nysicola]UAJ65914.1 peptidoglycan glycosyltransferase MrdB [Candidatus Schneideria nysicola]